MQLIEERRVVPVVGQDLLTVNDGGSGRLLYSYLAEHLAGYLGVPTADLPQGNELHEVACRYLAGGNQVEDIYAALKTIGAKADALPIPEPLLQLAAIAPLQLFVTTTFDAFLPRALDHVRFGGTPTTRVCAYAPTEVEDLPRDTRSTAAPVVYHLLGKLSAMPAYAVTQEDLVEFFHALQSDTRRPPLLFDELNRQSLLMLGTGFDGWLARFFLRLAKRQRLSASGKTDYVADSEISRDTNLVLFLQRFSRAKIFRTGGAIAFVQELYERWMERHPLAPAEPAAHVRSVPGAADMEPGAVFLSYASEDRAAVDKIKEALEAAGVDVFFDWEDLHAGEAWEAKLQRRVRDCSLFVPIISRHTLTADRRFFRVEWNLALDVAKMVSFAEEECYLLPVVIDDTTADAPAIPARFKAAQWQALPGGQTTPEFVARVQQLYRKYQKAVAGAS